MRAYALSLLIALAAAIAACVDRVDRQPPVPLRDEMTQGGRPMSSVEDAGQAPSADQNRLVEGRGVIFSASYASEQAGIEPELARFTPTEDDVQTAEDLIAAQLPRLLETHPDAQRIISALPQYRRQYFGVMNRKGHRSLRIHFFHRGEEHDDSWKREVVSVRGGGHRYFELSVDLDEKRCRGLHVHGPR
ncbi:MAG: hypothetical protein JXR96_09955 [Deltaproteobacteria bacterium]|nr:hypothetical protein [Deltaproteobacteria bacterium]